MRVFTATFLGITLAACGGGGSSTPTGPPVVVATPTPNPLPTPTPSPSNCPDGACGNTNTVVRAQLRLYLMMDDKGTLIVPTPDPVKQVLEQPVPVGYTIRLDVSGRDANGDESNGKGQIQWFYSGEDLIHTNMRTAWQRDIIVARPGTWSVYVVFDGVGSNDLTFTFVAK